ncbi:MAG: 50S ribosomal protein L23 [Planctomycetaceae bacterium]|jgi:large subunit ribosomal protein L23|nr:50S ribosomal protein L23 [Planctomycetaceae bacterium]
MPRQTDITKVNLKLEPYQIVLRPLVTEKGYHRAEHQNTYFFEVHKLANKVQIKEAVETLFDVKVDEVRTQNRHGKKVRGRRGGYGTRRDWKKAIVKLNSEHKISYF